MHMYMLVVVVKEVKGKMGGKVWADLVNIFGFSNTLEFYILERMDVFPNIVKEHFKNWNLPGQEPKGCLLNVFLSLL